MIKAISHRKLGRPVSHRFSLLRNLSTSLILHETIKTTFPKCKELARFIEKLITIAKEKNLTSIRRIERDIKNVNARKKLFDIIAPRYKDREGGYVRVLRLTYRKGNGAEIGIVKFS